MACDFANCGAEGTVDARPREEGPASGGSGVGLGDWGEMYHGSRLFLLNVSVLTAEAGGRKHGCTCSDQIQLQQGGLDGFSAAPADR